MRPDAKVAQQLERLETVEWLYDGLGGKVIAWTKAHGGTSDDPSGQAFLVARDGTVQSRCPDAAVHAAGSFEGWLKEQADLYEKQHPRTRLSLLPASVKVEGEPRKISCPALDEARAAKTPVCSTWGATAWARRVPRTTRNPCGPR